MYDEEVEPEVYERVMKFVCDSEKYDPATYSVYPVYSTHLADGKYVIPSWQSYNDSAESFIPICGQPDRIIIDPSFLDAESYIDDTGKIVQLTGMAG